MVSDARAKPLPYDKMKASQRRDDHFPALIGDARLSDMQRQVLRHLIKLQKASLRIHVMALPLAHRAGYVVREPDAGDDTRRRASRRRGPPY